MLVYCANGLNKRPVKKTAGLFRCLLQGLSRTSMLIVQEVDGTCAERRQMQCKKHAAECWLIWCP